MSVLSDMYNVSYTQLRSVSSSSTGTDTVSTISTGNCLIRPITDKSQLFNESNWGKEYKMWCDEDIAVRPGDFFIISSATYGVAGIPEFIDLVDDSDSHLEVRIYKR